MNNYAFYKEQYDKEIDRKLHLDNSINIPIGLITIIVGLIYFILKTYPFGVSDSISLIIKVSMTFEILLLFISAYFLGKVYNNLFKGFRYKLLPFSLELKDYQNKLNEFNKQANENDKEDFENYLINKFIDNSDNNGRINNKRNNNLYIAKTLIFITIILTLISVLISSLKIYIL